MKEISFGTLFKALLRKWLLIGLCAAAGLFLMAFYALLNQNLTENLYKKEVTVALYYGKTDKAESNLLDVVYSYLSSDGYRYAIYNAVKDTVLQRSEYKKLETNNAQETEKRQSALFFRRLTISIEKINPRMDLYAIDYEEAAAALILNQALTQAQNWMKDFADTFNNKEREEVSTAANKERTDASPVADDSAASASGDALIISVFDNGEMLSIFPEDYRVDGVVTAVNRVGTVVVGGVAGLIAGALIALALYFFNGKLNSANMLDHMGIPFIARVRNRETEGAWAEAAVKLQFLPEFNPAAAGGDGGETSAPPMPAKRHEGPETLVMLSFGNGGLAQQVADGVKAELGEEGEGLTLIGGTAGKNYGFVRAAAKTGGVVFCLDGKADRVKAVKAAKAILDASGVPVRGGIIVEPGGGFII
ncbi:MAG: hypothetical protein LBL66_01825 [Clostridiales bacterium]|jgi:capsular polysaccharide biosynthesis protein|nr:hypothetical protein [Clostridiales bacterium]